MKDTKLIKILRTFTPSEFRDFEKFVESPYFSQGRDLSDFFKIIKAFYPEFSHESFTTKNIYEGLYPGRKFEYNVSENIIYKLSSDLYKLCKEFLIYNELKSDQSRKYFYLLNKLREKKLYSEFEKELKYSESLNENNVRGGVNDFINKYFIEHSFLEYCVERGEIKNAFESILSLGEYAAIISLIKGFRNIDTNKTSEAFNIKPRYNLIDNLIDHLDSENLLDQMKMNNDRFYPYAVVSYAIHKIYKYPDDEKNYFDLKKLLNEYISLFGHNEKYILFQSMIGYCSKRLHPGQHKLFEREEFDIYKVSFELGVYKFDEKDKIQVNNFRSIILSAIDNREIDWLEAFVRDYTCELHSEHQENMKYFAFAYIHFYKKNFDKALENIMKVKYDFPLFKMDVKNLMFRIYFDTNYFEQAYSVLDAMKHYIANTKDLSEEFKNRGRNFIKYTVKILKARNSGNTADLAQYKKIIEKEQYLDSRKWLIEKIDEISE